MNIYKIYFGYLIDAINSFKYDFNHTFDITKSIGKLTLEPPKDINNGDMSTNMAMIFFSKLTTSGSAK